MAAAYVIILPSPDRLVSADNLRCCSDRTDDDYDRAVALSVGDRRFVDSRTERGSRRVELIVTGSAKDVGVFRRVDARESLPQMRRKNLLWPPEQ